MKKLFGVLVLLLATFVAVPANAVTNYRFFNSGLTTDPVSFQTYNNTFVGYWATNWRSGLGYTEFPAGSPVYVTGGNKLFVNSTTAALQGLLTEGITVKSIEASANIGGGGVSTQTPVAAFFDSATYGYLKGGTLGFGGRFNSAGDFTTFAQIGGFKADAVSGNDGGIFQLATRTTSGALEYRMWVDQFGDIGIATFTPNVLSIGTTFTQGNNKTIFNIGAFEDDVRFVLDGRNVFFDLVDSNAVANSRWLQIKQADGALTLAAMNDNNTVKETLLTVSNSGSMVISGDLTVSNDTASSSTAVTIANTSGANIGSALTVTTASANSGSTGVTATGGTGVRANQTAGTTGGSALVATGGSQIANKAISATTSGTGVNAYGLQVDAAEAPAIYAASNSATNTQPTVVIKEHSTGQAASTKLLQLQNQSSTPVASIDVDGKLFERSRSIGLGDWVTVPYVAGNFTASGGSSPTWTRSVAPAVIQYARVGQVMFFSLVSEAGTITGSPTELRVALPDGLISSNVTVQTITMNNGGAIVPAVVQTYAGQDHIKIAKANFSAFTNDSGTFAVYMVLTIGVQD